MLMTLFLLLAFLFSLLLIPMKKFLTNLTMKVLGPGSPPVHALLSFSGISDGCENSSKSSCPVSISEFVGRVSGMSSVGRVSVMFYVGHVSGILKVGRIGELIRLLGLITLSGSIRLTGLIRLIL